MKRPLYFLLTLSILLVFSCRHEEKSRNSIIPVFSTYSSDTAKSSVKPPKNEIFYGILTPVEIFTIFNRLGITYNNAALNPVSNREQYLSSSKASINTGVYGVDFAYLKVFGIGQQMIDYMVTIRDMSNKLGIPDKYLTEPIKRVQSDMSEPDTILFLMDDAYTKMEAHLRESGRESTAGLMILGGWVEAMYIATQVVYNPEKPDVKW